MNKTEFKAEVKKQLTLKDWSYKELSERTGYKQQSIQVMMCYDEKLTPRAMSKIAEVLGIDVFEAADDKGGRFPRTVYAIMHNKTKKIYIGSSKDVTARYVSHIQALRKGKHIVEDLQSDFEKFGEDFSLFILDEISGLSESDKEYEWMEKYKTYNRSHGYNYKDKAFLSWKGSIKVPLKQGHPPLPVENETAYDKIAIGNRIKQSRKAMEMTQDDLAERAGYSNRSSIARIETGLADIPGEKLLLLANILNTSVQYLQTGVDH